MQVLIVIGSSQPDSRCHLLGQEISSRLKKQGMETTAIDLYQMSLPFADAVYHNKPDKNPSPKVQKLLRMTERADAFVLISPVYHNSYSALIKNALDHLTITQFEGKAVALCSNGANRNTQAVDHLRLVARGLKAIAIPTQVCTDGKMDYLDKKNGPKLNNPDISMRLDRLCEELVRLGTALNKVR